MKKIKEFKFIIFVIIFATIPFTLVFFEKESSPEKHIIEENGTETGVEIEVMLKGGGTATLVCPKFDNEPRGTKGTECYLRAYDNTKTNIPK